MSLTLKYTNMSLTLKYTNMSLTSKYTNMSLTFWFNVHLNLWILKRFHDNNHLFIIWPLWLTLGLMIKGLTKKSVFYVITLDKNCKRFIVIFSYWFWSYYFLHDIREKILKPLKKLLSRCDFLVWDELASSTHINLIRPN